MSMFIASPFAGRRASDGSYIALHPSKRAQTFPSLLKQKVMAPSNTTAPLIPDQIFPGLYISE